MRVYRLPQETLVISLFILCRQNESSPPVRPSSAELPPLERTGSPTGAEKDILVSKSCHKIYGNAEIGSGLEQCFIKTFLNFCS